MALLLLVLSFVLLDIHDTWMTCRFLITIVLSVHRFVFLICLFLLVIIPVLVFVPGAVVILVTNSPVKIVAPPMYAVILI